MAKQLSLSKKKYYAYLIPAKGKRGIVESWAECEKFVSGVPGAKYRSFPTHESAEAWLSGGAEYEKRAVREAVKLEKGIYFDAGTGRGSGVEASVTDEKGRDLLGLIVPKKKLNKFGKLPVPSATNNYGELLACEHALQIAMKLGERQVFGDSRLVVQFWSKGFVKENGVDRATVRLVRKVAELRKEFEKEGGSIGFVPGDYNPADLGFH